MHFMHVLNANILCSFCFNSTQTTYTSVESTFFKESDEPSVVTIKQSIRKLWYFV